MFKRNLFVGLESGHDNYWVNDSGKYIPPNDSLYDPNQDESVKSQYWTRGSEGR